MKIFYVFDDFYSEGPVWLNVLWPQYKALTEVVDTVYIPKPAKERNTSRLARLLSRSPVISRSNRELHEHIINNLDPVGPNVLLVLALRYQDIDWVRRLHPIWSAFTHTVLCLTDVFESRFMSPGVVQKFDLVTSYCEDLRGELTKTFNVPTLFLPSHTDVLNYHSAQSYRPIDLLLVGRRDKYLHPGLHQHFNARNRNRVFLDFVTRTQTPITVQNEFELLMATYSRSAAAFCYESSGMPRFLGRSPMTGRWVHAWASGCTVFGGKPRGLGVEKLVNWPESVIELPSQLSDAIEIIEETLANEQGLLERRYRNVTEALLRHDSRYRYRDILTALSLPLPSKMLDAIGLLEEKAQQISRFGGDPGRNTELSGH